MFDNSDNKGIPHEERAVLRVYFRDLSIKHAESCMSRVEHVSLLEFLRCETSEVAGFDAVMTEHFAFLRPVLGALAADDVLEAGWGGSAFGGDDSPEGAIQGVWHR